MPWDPHSEPAREIVDGEVLDRDALNGSFRAATSVRSAHVGAPPGVITLTTIETWYGTGVILPDSTIADWLLVRLNRSFWRWISNGERAQIDPGTIGGDVVEDEIYVDFFELFGALRAQVIALGVAADGELLIARMNTNGSDYDVSVAVRCITETVVEATE